MKKVSGWKVERLGDICEVLDSKRKPITKRDRTAGKYPYYGATGILDYVHEYIFDEKLVLIGEDGAKWESGEYTAFIAEGKYWVNNHAHVIRPNRSIVLDEWIVYFLYVSDLHKYVTGLTVPKLNQEKMRSIEIPVPPLPEQQRIVSLLDETFAALTKVHANAERNQVNAREVFEAELAEIYDSAGKNWEEKKLGDIASEMQTGPFGSTLHKSDYVTNGIPVINPQNIVNGEIIPLQKMMISQKTKERLSRYILQEKDIVLARRGEMGRCAIVKKEQAGWVCGSGSFVIRLKKEVDANYLVRYLSSTKIKHVLQKGSVGTTMDNLNQGILSDIDIPFPPLAEQRAIVQRLDGLAKETRRLEEVYQQKLEAVEELRKSVLQKTFNGEL